MKRWLSAVGLLLAATVPLSAQAAQCPASSSLDGTFKSKDLGSYQIRQVGSTVWWIGKSKDGGLSWTNVFRGTRKGDLITGTWADITPDGGSGTLTLKVGQNNQLRRVSMTGSGFGGSIWLRPGCTYSNATPID